MQAQPATNQMPSYWTKDRFDILSNIWGKNNLYPGGSELIMQYIKSFDLDSSNNFLDLEAGSAGLVENIIEKHGAWSTAIINDPVLCDFVQGNLKIKNSNKKRLSLEYIGDDLSSLRENFYSSVVMWWKGFTIDNKGLFFDQLGATLKSDAQISIGDIISQSDKAMNFELLHKGEMRKLQFWSVNDYTSCFAAMNFDIRVKEDITDKIRILIQDSWKSFMATKKFKKYCQDYGLILKEETLFWMTLQELFNDGKLKFYRFHAIKR